MGGKAKSTNNEVLQFEKEQAAEARRKEAERQSRLETGKANIDAIFTGGGFDDAFYGKYKNAALGFQLPQLEDQYQKQREQTTYDLARAGLLRSSGAGRAVSDIEQQKAMQEAAIRAGADQQVADLRKNVSGQQSAALSQLYATEDPNIAANTAIQSVQQAQLQTPNLQPLGELFKPLIIGGTAAASGLYNQNVANTLYPKSPSYGGSYSNVA